MAAEPKGTAAAAIVRVSSALSAIADAAADIDRGHTALTSAPISNRECLELIFDELAAGLEAFFREVAGKSDAEDAEAELTLRAEENEARLLPDLIGHDRLELLGAIGALPSC